MLRAKLVCTIQWWWCLMVESSIVYNSFYVNKHQTPMNTITITYDLIYQLDFAPEYQWTNCKKCFNVKRGKQIKQVMQGGSIGYNIRSKFYSLTKLKKHLQKITNEDNPLLYKLIKSMHNET